MAAPEVLVPLTATIPASLMDALKDMAGANERSVAGEVRLALRAHVDSQPKAKRRGAA